MKSGSGTTRKGQRLLVSKVLFEYEVIEMSRLPLPNDRSSANEEKDIVDSGYTVEIDQEMQLNGEEPSNQQFQLVRDDASDASSASNEE